MLQEINLLAATSRKFSGEKRQLPMKTLYVASSDQEMQESVKEESIYLGQLDRVSGAYRAKAKATPTSKMLDTNKGKDKPYQSASTPSTMGPMT